MGAVASSVLKCAAKGVWSVAKGLWNAPGNTANDAVSAAQNPAAALNSIEDSASSTLADFTKTVTNPGEAVADVSSWSEKEGVEGVTEALIGGTLEVAGVAVRDATGTGPNCTADISEGAVFNRIDSFDGAVSLMHTLDGNIHSFNINALEETLLFVGRENLAIMFSGIQRYLLGDARGKVLHGYSDELAMHGVSRLRFSDVSAKPRTISLV